MASAGEMSLFQFAGEARDPGGLTFLRARYLDTTTGRFISHDPWPGDRLRPQSFNGWSYVENNPVNLIDPTGLTPDFPTHCRTVLSKAAYEQCVRSYFNLDPIDEAAPCKIEGTPGCYYGPIPYRAWGYLEGLSAAGTVVAGPTWGKEIVYDFATMERRKFEYYGITAADSIGLGGTNYVGVLSGFRSWTDIKADYEGFFNVMTAGKGILRIPGTKIGLASTGLSYFEGHPDNSVRGGAWYIGAGPSAGVGLDLLPFVDVGISVVYYEALDEGHQRYILSGEGRAKQVDMSALLSDIESGTETPWIPDILGIIPSSLNPRTIGKSMALHWAGLYDEIHYYSYLPAQ